MFCFYKFDESLTSANLRIAKLRILPINANVLHVLATFV